MLTVTETRKPWEQSWNGKFWNDMPGSTLEDQRINFALWKRGLIQLDEVRVELTHPDGEKEIRTSLVNSFAGFKSRRKTVKVKSVGTRWLALQSEEGRRLTKLREADRKRSQWAASSKGRTSERQQTNFEAYLRLRKEVGSWLGVRNRLAAACEVSLDVFDRWRDEDKRMTGPELMKFEAELRLLQRTVEIHRGDALECRSMWVRLKTLEGRGCQNAVSVLAGLSPKVMMLLEAKPLKVSAESLRRVKPVLEQRLGNRTEGVEND